MSADKIDSVGLISKAALSQQYRDKLDQLYGETTAVISVTDLQSLSIPKIVAALRAIRYQTVAIPLETRQVRGLLPTLQMLACLTRAHTLEIVDEDLVRTQFSRASLVLTPLRFAWACTAGFASALWCRLWLVFLGRAGRKASQRDQLRRVLYVNANLWFGVKAGGSVGHIAGVVNALIARGNTVTFAACGGPVQGQARAAHFELQAPRVFGLPVEFSNYRFHTGATRELLALARREPFDFIYQRLSLGNFSGVVMARQLGIPLIVEYNGSEAWVATHWGRPLRYPRLAINAEDAMLQHADLIVTVSDVLRQELVARGIDGERIVMYPNCIDPSIFDPQRYSENDRASVRNRHCLSPSQLLVTFVGTFGQWHGVEVFANAIALMARADRELLRHYDVHFLFVGDGLKMPEVRRSLDAVDTKLYTLGGLVPQAEAPAYLACSDILVSPHVRNPDGSRFFGSPTKLFEYMAMGKAIAASDLEQIGDVLRPSLVVTALPESPPAIGTAELAVMTEPGSVEQLCQALRFLIRRPDWRAVLGANAMATARAKYTWDRHVSEIITGLARARIS